ncbi:Hypothetical protein PHPALM_5893 [Phytophthora palmivora]|uniref:Uncharacterized protein n=1 Tax=Phytophthora palmivora TaxID=4796 RepID=A0A2P4YGA5_9STRA|nr:Hypothetical protein PHPALM_5893 [Phytophthora palmivora]
MCAFNEDKVEATKKIEEFLVFLEKRLIGTLIRRMCRNESPRNVYPFFIAAGFMRQVSEHKNRVSNGKAERMHCMVLNMTCCMFFASGHPLYF